MSEWLLPLFPLQVVLFPRTDLPLHIFEDRYKQMIAECLENRWEFGVVLAQDQSLEQTGCTAVISEVVKNYEDGRMDILVRGSRRFEILLLNEEKPYLRGEAQFFDDEEDSLPSGDSRRQRAVELYARAKEMLPSEDRVRDEGKPEASDQQLSYQIMSRLPVDLEFKQSLLPLKSEEERLSRVIPYLEKLVAHLALLTKARTSAGGNGKGR